MKFSEQLEARYSEMLTHYPVKRSLLVPFLLYIQDEFGYVTDDSIEEIAKRLEISPLEVRNVISYYSMLRTKPSGKYNVQVCTNICCQLRGGEEMLGHVREKLGVKVNKEVTSDGIFSVEEVECIGACSWAPAMQVNYDFHENLTPEKIDQILDEYRQKAVQE
ncbi:MAG: NAD(P)H-dependent oxidoreductase subunit E [Acidobacteria bacterium]|nr:MAG: NAD(P)H-dependent oxidoreductase subunit E [Acidobacteriota bacterium]